MGLRENLLKLAEQIPEETWRGMMREHLVLLHQITTINNADDEVFYALKKVGDIYMAVTDEVAIKKNWPLTPTQQEAVENLVATAVKGEG